MPLLSSSITNTAFDPKDPTQLAQALSYLAQDIKAISQTGAGDVTGQGASTNSNIPLYVGTTGKTISDSGIAASDVSAAITAVGTLQTSVTTLLAKTPGQLVMFISQAGAAPPTIDTLVTNTTINPATPTFSRPNPGDYNLTLTGAFPQDKVAPLSGDPDGLGLSQAFPLFQNGALAGTVFIRWVSANVINILTRDSGGSPGDDVLTGFCLQLSIYP